MLSSVYRIAIAILVFEIQPLKVVYPRQFPRRGLGLNEDAPCVIQGSVKFHGSTLHWVLCASAYVATRENPSLSRVNEPFKFRIIQYGFLQLRTWAFFACDKLSSTSRRGKGQWEHPAGRTRQTRRRLNTREIWRADSWIGLTPGIASSQRRKSQPFSWTAATAQRCCCQRFIGSCWFPSIQHIIYFLTVFVCSYGFLSPRRSKHTDCIQVKYLGSSNLLYHSTLGAYAEGIKLRYWSKGKTAFWQLNFPLSTVQYTVHDSKIIYLPICTWLCLHL